MVVLVKITERWKSITVEPIVFLFYWSMPYINHGNGALLFRNFCLESYNRTLCDNMSSYEAENNIVQGETSRWIMYHNAIMILPMIYCTVILGAISDRFKRKLPMLLPVLGASLGTLWLMFLSLFSYLNVRLLLVSSLIFGVTGFNAAVMMATSAYLGHLTTATDRTWRIAMFEAAIALGMLGGNFTSGLVIDHIGLSALYGMTAGMNLLASIYIISRVAETHAPQKEKPHWTAWFGCSHVRSYFVTIYKTRLQNRRFFIHMIFAAYMATQCSTHGLYDVLFLYLTKARGFTNTMFSVFTGTQYVLSLFANLVIIWILQQKLRVTEPWILFIAASGGLISYSMISAESELVIWLSLVFAVPIHLGAAACRGFLSKLVPKEEQGQVFAFISMGQSVNVLLASIVFNGIYPTTLQFWDGLCSLIAGLLNIMTLALSLIVVIYRRRTKLDDDKLVLIDEISQSYGSSESREEPFLCYDSDYSYIIDQTGHYHAPEISIGEIVQSFRTTKNSRINM